MRYQRPIGTQDVTPEVAPEWRYVEEQFRAFAERYGYGELRTPIFEETDLFLRSVGETSDIVSKEMYTFEDRGGRSLTLRPEGTAPAVRAYLENHLERTDRQRLVKLYYIAPIFRYDRPQAGRYRQHHQLGLEAIGSANPAVDAEIISFAWHFYRQLGLHGVRLLLNSVGCPSCAPAYVAELKAALANVLNELCADCQRRYKENPLRILDCKRCRPLVAEKAPLMIDRLCDDCATHWQNLLALLETLGVPYEIDPTIVRGLDYYTKTAFEFQIEGIGAQAALGGGGRYDGLVEQCGGPPTPAVGLGLGLERILLARQQQGLRAPRPAREGVFVVVIGDALWPEALRLLQALRLAGLKAEIDYRRRSLKAQLRFADSENYAHAILLGEEEWAQGLVSIKDLQTGQQRAIARHELLEEIR